MSEELKPCPFCGERPTLTVRPDNAQASAYYAAVSCFCDGYSTCAHKDGTAIDPDEAERKARHAWNTRPSVTQAAPGVRALTDDEIVSAARGAGFNIITNDETASLLRIARAVLKAGCAAQSPLKNEQIRELYRTQRFDDEVTFARAVERAHGITAGDTTTGG